MTKFQSIEFLNHETQLFDNILGSVDYNINISSISSINDTLPINARRQGNELVISSLDRSGKSIFIVDSIFGTIGSYNELLRFPLYNPPSNSNLDNNRNFSIATNGFTIVIVRQATSNTIKIDEYDISTLVEPNELDGLQKSITIQIPDTDVINIAHDNNFVKILLNKDFVFTYEIFNLDDFPPINNNNEEIIDEEIIDEEIIEFGFNTINAEFISSNPYALNVSDKDIIIVDGNRFIEFDFENVLYGEYDFITVDNIDQIISVKSYNDATNTISSKSLGYVVIGISNETQRNFYLTDNQFFGIDIENTTKIQLEKFNEYENILAIFNGIGNDINTNIFLIPTINNEGTKLLNGFRKKMNSRTLNTLDFLSDDDNDDVLINTIELDENKKFIGTISVKFLNSNTMDLEVGSGMILINTNGLKKFYVLYGESFSTNVVEIIPDKCC
jgi:hypothetical protein